MVLRDAIYLYNRDIHSYYYLEVVGYHCDVLELALDLSAGYTDIDMWEGAKRLTYPDRIRDYHEMFAYALYDLNVSYKSFLLTDRTVVNPSQDTVTGSGTVFGYCYSTRPDAYIFRYDSRLNTCARNLGAISCPAGGSWEY